MRAQAKIDRNRARIRKKTEALRESLLAAGGEDKLVTAERRDIVDTDIHALLDRLRSGDLKPVEVLEAFQVGEGKSV